MKKFVLTLAISIMVLFTLAISVFATEYTVSSDAEYQTAYEQAVNGDTIVVAGKLSCDIYANKSITYVLKADWESSKLVVDTPNVEVSFIADGGDYRIMPTNYSTTDGWMNIAESYENVVINFGGKNGGTVTIDGSNATHDRVTYVGGAAITLNLLDGSAIANFNTETKDDSEKACIIYASTVNMYEGCKIYANRIISAPLIKSNNFNLFGGEIFGNLLTSTRTKLSGVGVIYAYNQFTMYGGKLYGNIFNATSGPSGVNAVGFISVRYGYQGAKMVVYGGEIGDNYVSGNGKYEISAMFGINDTEAATSYFYYNTAVKGTRYKFTDTPTLAFDENTGKTIWKVNTYSLLSSNWNGWCWKQTKVWGVKSAIFLNAQKKNIAGTNFDTYEVINAYIYGGSGEDANKNPAGDYAHSGSTTVAIPSGYELWSTSGSEYCHTGKTYTLDEVNANSITLYTAYEAERVTVNGVTKCSGCGMIYSCNNPEHDHEVISITYESYEKQGEKTVKCNTCNVVTVYNAPALFICLGYSAPEDGRSGIAVGYTVNNEAIEDLEKSSGKTINYGVFAVRQDKLGDSPVFDEEGNTANGVVNIDITSYKFDAFEFKIVGFKDEQKDTKFAMGAYITTKMGEATEYSFLQAGAISENESYHFASYNDIIDLIPDEVVEFEDIVLKADEEVTLPSTVMVNGVEKEITYSFEGENISIENNVLKGLVKGSETTVTVTGKKVTGTFKVKVESDIYKYVVVIGVDGAGTFFKDADTPH